MPLEIPDGHIICQMCKGEGYVLGGYGKLTRYTCPRCNGKGYYKDMRSKRWKKETQVKGIGEKE